MKPILNKYTAQYVYDWLDEPEKHRFFGYPSQVWLKNYEDVLSHMGVPMNVWLKNQLTIKNGEQPQHKKRYVEDYFITLPYYECTIAKYATTNNPRTQYGRTQCLVLDFDHDTYPEQSYIDMQRIIEYIHQKTGQYPMIHSSGKQGYHIFIHLPYPVDSTYKHGVEQVLRKICYLADVKVPTNDEIRRSHNKYDGPDKITPEEKDWTVDPSVLRDITQSRLIRVPFTPRNNGNYCWPVTPSMTYEERHKTKEEIRYERFQWNELVPWIIKEEKLYRHQNTEKQIYQQTQQHYYKKNPGTIDFTSIDCRTVWDKLFGHESNEGKYLRSYCPTCNSGRDRSQPSVRVFSNGYKCHGSCNGHGGPYQICELKGMDKKKILEFLGGI